MVDKKKVIERMWTTFDRIFFGQTSPKNFFEMEDYHDYCTLKTSLLTEVMELYKHLNFDPKWLFSENYNPDKLINKSKIITEKLLTAPKFKKNLKETIVESYKHNSQEDLNNIIAEKVKVLSMSLLVDNTFLYEPTKVLQESTTNKSFDEVSFTITQSTYNLFKNELVEMINEAVKKKAGEKKSTKSKNTDKNKNAKKDVKKDKTTKDNDKSKEKQKSKPTRNNSQSASTKKKSVNKGSKSKK
jgi:hypothetical protein